MIGPSANPQPASSRPSIVPDLSRQSLDFTKLLSTAAGRTIEVRKAGIPDLKVLPERNGELIATEVINSMGNSIMAAASRGSTATVIAAFSFPGDRVDRPEFAAITHAVKIVRKFCAAQGINLREDVHNANLSKRFGPSGASTRTVVLWVSWKTEYEAAERAIRELKERRRRRPG